MKIFTAIKNWIADILFVMSIRKENRMGIRNGGTGKFLPKMSREYRLHIFASHNEYFPYYVAEWDECFTEQEIHIHANNYTYNKTLSEEYGVSVYDTHDDDFHYYVAEWDELLQDQEQITEYLPDWQMIESLEAGVQ